MPTINKEGTVLDADVCASEAFRDVTAVTAIFEQVGEPPLNGLIGFLSFKQADFFEGGKCASQTQRKAARDGEDGSGRSRG